MKIDLKNLFKKILDHRKDPKIFVAVFTILLSCISFGYCAGSFQQSNDFYINSPSFYQFSPFSDLQDNSITDGFVCFLIGGGKIDSFALSDNNWNNINYFDGRDIGNFASPVCTYISDFSQNYYLMIQSSYGISVQYYYMYVLQTPPTPQVSCYTGRFSVMLYDRTTYSSEVFVYDISPYVYTDIGYKVNYRSSVMEIYTGSNAVDITSTVNCSSCESDLNTCSTNFQSCQGYLSSCQSDLNSASGYVSSLEGELNQCTNDLINCSNSSNTGSCETGSNWSALYINDIQHLGKPNIFITIPEEIGWYYTSEGDDFNLNVSGYNVDTEYIENVIDIQNTKPSQDDFNKIISEVIPLFIPGLFIVLFIYFVFRFVKKVF